jgi:ferredoxin-NADP reductase
MFTQTSPRSQRRAAVLDMLLGPHGVDRYTELLDPMWTSESRATVVNVRRTTPGSVTLWLEPNRPVSHRAGQYLSLTVEIDGRRHTRCYSPANAEGTPLIELTISRHEGGLVSEYLYRRARRGIVVDLAAPAGDFVLPAPVPQRLLLIAGGSGITPVMSIARTLHAKGFRGDITVLHYVPTLTEACYRSELAQLAGVRVLYGCTRGDGGELSGHLTEAHLATAMAEPDAVYVCGPPALVDAVREHHPDAIAESFAPRPRIASASGGRVSFRDSGIQADDDGRSLLEQAEAAGLAPQSGCRMGICHTCTCRKLRGTVRNLNTGAVSTADDQDVQICVSVPVGDVEIAL